MIAKRARAGAPARLHELGRLHHRRQDGRHAQPTPPTSSIASSRRRAEAAQREYAALLKRKQQDVPGATVVNAWESSYYAELVRKASYDFDSQAVRPYFPFDRVKQGLLDVTSRLFGVTYRPRERTRRCGTRRSRPTRCSRAASWSGRFYLDMHPRAGQVQPRGAVRHPHRRRRTADSRGARSSATCPGGEAGDPGLMTHDDVETFFHEFGHLVHALLGGQRTVVRHQRHQHRAGLRRGAVADARGVDAGIRRRWPRSRSTTRPASRFPRELVRQMRRAERVRPGRSTCAAQMFYARISLSLYDRDPAQVNTDRDRASELDARVPAVPVDDGTHFQTSFGHLDGYSAIYYTYMWSLVIAKDLFSQFDRCDLLAPAPARRYRDADPRAGRIGTRRPRWCSASSDARSVSTPGGAGWTRASRKPPQETAGARTGTSGRALHEPGVEPPASCPPAAK